MICQRCRSENLNDAEFCSSCGVQLAEQVGDSDWLAGLVADADAEASIVDQGGPPTEPTDLPTAPKLNEPTPEPVEPLDATAPMPDTAPAAAPRPAPPSATPIEHEATAVAATTAPPALGVRPAPATRRSSSLPIVLALTAIAALVIVGALVLLRPSDSADTAIDGTEIDDTNTPATDAPVDNGLDPATTTPDTTAPGETATTAPTEDDSAATTTPDTTPATTAPATTVAPTTTPEPSTTPATTAPAPDDPAAVPPLPDEPGPIDAVGSAQVLANVLPSGLASTDVIQSFTLAQEFADALALEDWDVARALAPGTAGSSDSDFELGYGATNRISLMLVDATAIANGHRVVAVSVAVENNGTQTSLYCLVWDVDPTGRTVEQVSGGRIERWADNVQPEAIRNDPSIMATVTSCDAS